MTKLCLELINIYIILVVLVANIDGNTHLDLLFKNASRYEHYQENFSEILSNDVTHFELRIKKTLVIETVIEDWHSILKNAKKQLVEFLLFESEAVVAKMQFIVVMSINALFPNYQGEVKNILREKNRNIEKQLKKK